MSATSDKILRLTRKRNALAFGLSRGKGGKAARAEIERIDGELARLRDKAKRANCWKPPTVPSVDEIAERVAEIRAGLGLPPAEYAR